MSFTLKLDLSKLLKLTDSQSWTPSAVQAIISELVPAHAGVILSFIYFNNNRS
ncbi:MAG: hypothetical protein K6A35_05650 [bacterium]|nr:hypothetical protein [bacterium]